MKRSMGLRGHEEADGGGLGCWMGWSDQRLRREATTAGTSPSAAAGRAASEAMTIRKAARMVAG